MASSSSSGLFIASVFIARSWSMRCVEERNDDYSTEMIVTQDEGRVYADLSTLTNNEGFFHRCASDISLGFHRCASDISLGFTGSKSTDNLLKEIGPLCIFPNISKLGIINLVQLGVISAIVLSISGKKK